MVVNNIQEQDIKDLADELVYELRLADLCNMDHEDILAYETIYKYLKNKYAKEESD